MYKIFNTPIPGKAGFEILSCFLLTLQIFVIPLLMENQTYSNKQKSSFIVDVTVIIKLKNQVYYLICKN